MSFLGLGSDRPAGQISLSSEDQELTTQKVAGAGGLRGRAPGETKAPDLFEERRNALGNLTQEQLERSILDFERDVLSGRFETIRGRRDIGDELQDEVKRREIGRLEQTAVQKSRAAQPTKPKGPAGPTTKPIARSTRFQPTDLNRDFLGL